MKQLYSLSLKGFLFLVLIFGLQKANAQAPTINTQPTNATVCAGSNASFFVFATGGTLSYQWQVDQGTGFSDISGATNFSYTASSVTSGMSGYVYRVKVTNTSGTTTSNSATLTVLTAPVVNVNPNSSTLCAGGSTSFSISAGGSGTLGYQWQVSTGGPFSNVPASSPYSGTTTNTLTVNPATAGMNGYVYQCVVTATSGGCSPAATSNTAVLTVNSAASISTNPSSNIVCAGSADSFKVVASGTNISYQWQYSTNGGSTWNNVPNSAPYSGTTSATLLISATTTGMDGYQYRCVVTSAVCSPAATSTAATLNVNSLPNVTTNPSNVTQCAGPGTSFTVAGTGTGISYQWQVSTNGGTTWTNLTTAGPYSGVNTTTLTLSSTTTAMNGYLYRCVISGTCTPAVNSTSALLTIQFAPSITTQPANSTVCPNTIDSFTVVATGAGFTYQWEYSTGGPFTNVPASSPYSGTTSSKLMINTAVTSMSGYQYRVVITGTCTPPVTSNAATLNFYTTPSTTNPSNSTVCVGVGTSFSVTASGTSPYSYQWQYSSNGGSTWNNVPASAPYSGTTSATLVISATTNAMNGYLYRCIVNGFCSPAATSNAATLTVNPAPSVTSQPRDTAGCPGTTVTFSVTGTGTGPLTYQWQISTNGGVSWSNVTAASPYSGTTSATLTVSPIVSTMNGYLYRCIISGGCSPAATSNSAKLNLNTVPSITSNPTSSTVCSGSPDSFQVSATGTSLTYQWQLSTNGGATWNNVPASSPYSGTTTNKLRINPTAAGMNGYLYRCVVSGTCTPSATSTSATLTVNTSPSITGQPSSVIICAGTNTFFRVTATGATLTYVWQYSTDGGSTWGNVPSSSPYSGANSNTLTITGATVGMNGFQYRVVVAGSCNPNAISNAATLTVLAAPSVTKQPANDTICAGMDTAFSITATGAGLGYQWQVSSGGPFTNVPAAAPYGGTTSTRLTITGATAGMNGYQYRCIVTGTCTPGATSQAATLVVNTSPAITTQPQDVITCINGSPSFTVVATGAGLTYQWQVNIGFGGWTTLTSSALYSGVNTATLTITGATLSMNNYQYRCIISGQCTPSVTTNPAILTVTTNTTWTGTISTAWSNPGNWACNTVPSATTNVTIPPTAPHQPQVDIPDAICDSMTIMSGASVAFSGAFNMLEIKGSVFNSGTFDASQGKVKFSGFGQQLMPSSTYFDLEVANSGDKILSDGDITVLDSLLFTDGYVAIGDYNLFVGPLGFMYGGTSTSYALTNGLGKVIDEGVGTGFKSGDNLIPIGALRNSYTPITFSNTGTPDTFRFFVYSAVYQYYFYDIPTTGTIDTNVVARSWVIQEYTPGGTNASVTVQWNASDEKPGFDRSACYMSHFNSSLTRWQQVTQAAAANGTGPYSMSITGVTSFSPFGVGSGTSPLPVNNVNRNNGTVIVYPNPVSGSVLYVKFSDFKAQDLNVRIIDVVGKTWNLHVSKDAIKNGVLPVDVSTLPQGVYQLVLSNTSGDQMHTIRFVKQ
jgi:hypothetical protein